MAKIIAAVAVIILGVGGLVLARTSGQDNAQVATEFGETLREQASATTTLGDTDTNKDTDTANTIPGGYEINDLGFKPELTDLSGWLQSDVESLSELDGKVKIVHFWAASCHNCHATFPFLAEIYKTHEGDDLEIVGVHAPEFDFEKDPATVQQQADNHGVVWPIALDNNKTNFRTWRPTNRAWPLTYVIDKQNKVRFVKRGEGAYEELAANVDYYLKQS